MKKNKYSHISLQEREKIYLYLNQGESIRGIAKILGRSHTSVAREIKRNKLEEFRNASISNIKYSPSDANAKYRRRRSLCKVGTRKLDIPNLRSYVVDKIQEGWSPEEISGRLKRINSRVIVSYETIYRFIYSKENRHLCLYDFLPKRKAKRSSLYSRKQKRARKLLIQGKISIDKRPYGANGRAEFGHWESDLMEGTRESLTALSVTTDRKSRYTLVDKIPNTKAESKLRSLERTLGAIPSVARSTLTVDNGSENACHKEISKRLGINTYFCNPYHSWEKGTVENTIGLIRRYIPKGTNLDNIPEDLVRSIQRDLNTRPRKCLDYQTPEEVMKKALTGALQS